MDSATGVQPTAEITNPPGHDRRATVVAVAFALLVLCAAFVVRGGPPRARGAVLESLAVIATFALLARSRALFGLFRSVGARYQGAALVLIGLVVGGHVAQQGEAMFPFVSWQMYGKVHTEDLVYDDYAAMRTTGETIPFIPSWAVQSLINARINRKLRAQMESIEAAREPAERAERTALHEATLQALITLYNARYPEAPIRTITVSRCRVPLQVYGTERSGTCQPVRAVTLAARGDL